MKKDKTPAGVLLGRIPQEGSAAMAPLLLNFFAFRLRRQRKPGAVSLRASVPFCAAGPFVRRSSRQAKGLLLFRDFAERRFGQTSILVATNDRAAFDYVRTFKAHDLDLSGFILFHLRYLLSRFREPCRIPARRKPYARCRSACKPDTLSHTRYRRSSLWSSSMCS